MFDLTYRDIRPNDCEDLHAMATQWPIVHQLGGWPWPPSAVFTRSRSKPYEGEGFVWAICIDDRLIGTVGVTGGDLGYMLNTAHHGQGIMSKAARAAIHHAFQTTARDHLTASTWFDNAASYRLLQKLGFLHWQTRYIHAKARNRPTLVQHQRLDRATWDHVNAGKELQG